jgi:two-component system sensor histidine kinase YesM
MKNGDYTEYAIGKLREEYFSSAWEYGTEYRIFLYTHDTDKLYQLSMSSDGNYTMSPDIAASIREQIDKLDEKTYAVKRKWDVLECDNEVYICKIAQKNGIALGCIVNVKSILEPFSKLSLGKHGYVSLVDQDEVCIGMLDQSGIISEPQSMNTQNTYTIRQGLSRAPFEIRIGISLGGVLSLMAGSLLGMTVLIFMILIMSGISLFHVYSNIMKPLKVFTQNLQQYDEGGYMLNMTEGNLLELEQIDGKFRTMIHQIRKLKITLYERELEKQKIEMDYLKMQIRPHFYLNCLNFIYSMIDFGDYEHARAMTKITSDYLSYIFRNTTDRVPVLAESKHCEDYLKILLLRYPDKFTYYIEVHDEVADAEIFPFLIQVYVENAAKQALMADEKMLISVTVYPEDRDDEKYVNIFISDTGKGFPDEILCKLQNGQNISDNGKHIGIWNCMRRFQYYYGDQGEIHFSNSPLGGAVVDIHVPYKIGRSDTQE